MKIQNSGVLTLPSKIKKHFADLSLRRKFSAITILFPVLILAASIAGLQLMYISGNRQLYESVNGTLSYSASVISEKLQNVEAMTGQMIADNRIQDTLSIASDSEQVAERANAYQTLAHTIPDYYQQYKQNGIRYIALYNNNYVTYSDYSRGRKVPEDVVQSLLANAHAQSGSPVWTTDYHEDFGIFLSRDIRRSKNLRLDVIGTVIVSIDVDDIIREATSAVGIAETPLFILYDNDGSRIYHSPELVSELPASVTNAQKNYGITRIDGNYYFYATGSVPTFQWQYICLTPYDGVMQTRLYFLAISIGIVVIAVLLGIFFSHRLIDSIVYHIERLLRKMDAYGQGDLEADPKEEAPSSRQDEIGRLYQQFDEMTRQVNDLIQKNYVNELLTKEAQLKALENQINPHFLYNTLESINWRAKSIGATEISVMVEALGNLLRSTLSGKNTQSTLSSELQIVRDYMAILKIRFDERLRYTIDVPSELLTAAIPKLTLQPLVENAVNYALEEMTETCTIQITGEQVDGEIRIRVSNTGSQFPDDLLGKLKSGEIKPHGLGIGILNVDHRLRLQFGEPYGLEFSNDELNEIAIVTMHLPAVN